MTSRCLGGWSLLPALVVAVVWTPPLLGQQAPKEQIGAVLGKPIYREDLRTEKASLRQELHRIFGEPISTKYHTAHKAEIEPTEAEIRAVQANLTKKHQESLQGEETEMRARLKEVKAKLAQGDLTAQTREELDREQTFLEIKLTPPGRELALFLLQNWKWQRHLYDKFGGGRILWQQMGVEAFDAHRRWLEHHEKQGDFKITDPKLRAIFYEYWTTMRHGPFLTDDPERLREFLAPEWAPKRQQDK